MKTKTIRNKIDQILKKNITEKEKNESLVNLYFREKKDIQKLTDWGYKTKKLNLLTKLITNSQQHENNIYKKINSDQ
jgi:hypothetical protein